MNRAETSALYEAAVAAHQAGRLSDAEAQYRRILAADAHHAGALHLLGVIALQRGDPRSAVALIRQSLAARPASAEALEHLGLALDAGGDAEDALDCYAKALELAPQSASTLCNRGALLLRLKRPGDACADLERAADLQAGDVATWVNLSAAQRQLHRAAAAVASADRAVQLDPQMPEAWLSRGNALLDGGHPEAALEDFRRALQISPGMPAALNGMAESLRTLKRHTEAAATLEALLRVQPNFPQARSKLLWARRQSCCWAEEPEELELLAGDVERGHDAAIPFTLLALIDDPRLQLRCAEAYARGADAGLRLPARRPDSASKIRLAYLSADFHEHATAYLMAELLERHDRARFELTAISVGPPDASPMRRRLVAAFDHFLDASSFSDEETARWIHERGIHIAVDLKGYTQDARPAILSYRPAPVQVQYLGYPGTMGAPWIDYIIGDEVVTPAGCEHWYAEQVVRLPVCYQPNDRARPLPKPGPSRSDLGLPETGTVYCCFNNNFKIGPEVFGCWMRILAAVPGSVLWLLEDTPDAARNLRSHAAAHGVDPSRLVFASRVPLAQHIDRHLLADLFLDTTPYGAHTTASDALWCGVPVLTCPGSTFASRVAASLVHAVGLPELAVSDWGTYEAEAIRLGSDRPRLRALRAYLLEQQAELQLFDVEQYRAALEGAYERMHAIAQADAPPNASFHSDQSS